MEIIKKERKGFLCQMRFCLGLEESQGSQEVEIRKKNMPGRGTARKKAESVGVFSCAKTKRKPVSLDCKAYGGK